MSGSGAEPRVDREATLRNLAANVRDLIRILLVVTDMVMPGGMTGLELAERLRRDRPDLPMIVLSGYSP